MNYVRFRTYFVHPWLAAHALKAFSTTSTILCDVNTFPAQTAAVGDGMSRDFFGILTAFNRELEKKSHKFEDSNTHL